MLLQGLILLVAGMGTVVLFLILMVVVMQGAGVLFKRYAHLLAPDSPPKSHITHIVQDERVAVAVAIAVAAAYRKH